VFLNQISHDSSNNIKETVGMILCEESYRASCHSRLSTYTGDFGGRIKFLPVGPWGLDLIGLAA